MHTEIKYDIDKDEGRQKAITDCKEWLGEERYHQIVADFKASEKVGQDHFQFLFGMTGIQGYPVRVMYEEIYGVEWSENVTN